MSNSLRAELSLQALEIAMWTRQMLTSAGLQIMSGKCIRTLRDAVVTLAAGDADQAHPYFLGHAPRGEVTLADVTTH